MHCTTEKMTIGHLFVEAARIDFDPTYQRETGVWSAEKQKLFIDSIINQFDIPKIYLHDLRYKGEPIQFAVIDGKQRLHSVFEFLKGRFGLSSDFKYMQDVENPPSPGMHFTDFSDEWKERFKSKPLDVVLVQNAEEEDIEELFSRLNNGEVLNAAEKRNALGGDMSNLIREVSRHRFFVKKMKIKNRRFAHFEICAKFLKIESNQLNGSGIFCDLKKKHLDQLVRDNKKMSSEQTEKLHSCVEKNLNALCKYFSDEDILLSKQSYPQMYYIFVKNIKEKYGHTQLDMKLKQFMAEFNRARLDNNNKDEENRNWNLAYFGQLSMQGTNDKSSLELREEIMREFFLKWNPDVQILDKKRNFDDVERQAIWERANRKCQICGCDMESINDMDADHVEKWAHGGQTILENARALCQQCNRANL